LKRHIALIEGKLEPQPSNRFAEHEELNEELMDADILEDQDHNYLNNENGYDEPMPQRKIVKKVKKHMDPQKQKEKGLQEIFNFYSKQHFISGNKITFEDIGKEGARLAYGDFIKMCADFQVPLKKDVITEVYRVKVKRGA
jgi:hypothetical protein